jgi:hypothetical protein
MSSRVAIVTDIHANLPALEAALARIEELGIERIYCGGDLVGYGPHQDGRERLRHRLDDGPERPQDPARDRRAARRLSTDRPGPPAGHAPAGGPQPPHTRRETS